MEFSSHCTVAGYCTQSTRISMAVGIWLGNAMSSIRLFCEAGAPQLPQGVLASIPDSASNGVTREFRYRQTTWSNPEQAQ